MKITRVFPILTTAISVFGLLLCLNAFGVGTTKLRVSDRKAAAALLADGGHLIADYGGFQIIELSTSAVWAASTAIESADDSNFIELNARRLDTRRPEIAALRKNIGDFAGKKLHLVQFAGPTKPEWRDALEQTGVEVVDYIPQNCYLVRGDAPTLAKLQNWARTANAVQWEGAYADDFKIHPKARVADINGNPSTPPTDVFTVQLLEDPAENAVTLALIEQLKLEPIRQQFHSLHYLNIVVRVPAERLTEIAARPDVISVQPHFPNHKLGERQDQIVAGNLSGSSPAGPGYLTWLASKGFTQAQFSSSGFVVDVTDSGIDNGTGTPGHFGLYQTGNKASASRVAYNRLEGSPNAGSTLQGCDGHGNLNSHIVAGYDDSLGFPFADVSGYHYGLGVCPFVKVGSSVIFDPDFFTFPDFADLQSRAYHDGARISANSWGSDGNGMYDAEAQTYDALVRDAQPAGSAFSTAGNQQMTIVFAAGNDGPSSITVGSPGTAKNIISVGAGEGVQAIGGTDASGVSDAGANSANDLISFSSRGPCTDGRTKPDLCAPGTHISGGVPQVNSPASTGTAIACFTGDGVSGGSGGTRYFPSGQQFYTASSGTSHSTPAVAGCCALVRQNFINHSLPAPSPAMTKAFLANSARYMTGGGANDTLFSNNQGMGEVNLGMAFDGVPRVLRDQLNADKFTASGQTRTINGTVADSGAPFRVTLAWSDAPGSTIGNAYKNNLDLTVTVGGNTYKGNIFAGSASTTGGSADTKNNLESVFMPAGVSGVFTVTVTAANINSDGVPNEAPSLDQDYALVIYNASATGLPPAIGTQPQSQTVGQGSAANFAVSATGDAPLRYQWFFNSSVITDATNSAYAIPSAQVSSEGNYFAVITNSNGGATSTVASLTVAVSPLILTNPSSLTVLAGGTAMFGVSAVGVAPLSYQWQFGGTSIPGATTNLFSKTNVQISDGGSYRVIITNSSGSVTSTPAILGITSTAASGVVISQIYGGSGNTGSTYRNDYVELFNPTTTALGLAGWSLQYASASGSTWAVTSLSGAIPAGGYYLVQLGSGGPTGAALPTPDAASTLNINAANGKVALVTNQTALTESNPVGGSAIVDFAGYGSANAFEGTGAAPSGANASAIFRKNGGAIDTDDNAADFLTGTPDPRNSSVTTLPAQPPTLSLLSLVNNQFQFTLTGTTTSNYVIEVSTNIANGAWIPVRTSTAPILFSEPATNIRRFYRGSIAH